MVRRRLIEAINDALVEEMEGDPKVVIYGEDVELSILGDVRGLHAQFGAGQCPQHADLRGDLDWHGGRVGGSRLPARVAHDVRQLPLHRDGRDRQPDGEAAADDRRPDGAPDHDHRQLWRWAQQRRPALGHAVSGADEPGRNQRPDPRQCSRRQGIAEDGDPRPQPVRVPRAVGPRRRLRRGPRRRPPRPIRETRRSCARATT